MSAQSTNTQSRFCPTTNPSAEQNLRVYAIAETILGYMPRTKLSSPVLK